MTRSFAWILTSIPLALGCLNNVPIADRTDGGAGDAPLTDAPPMDAPVAAACAACGGPASPSCLYAAGCGAVRRVCADNTCGDAVAIQFCGCDGREFVTGCLTPDRPWASRGPCVPDGGTVADVPTADAPAALAYCPEEVDTGNAQDPDLRYRRAAFALPPAANDGGSGDAGFANDVSGGGDGGADVDVVGTWAGLRALDTPMILGCPRGDARYACRHDTVIRVSAGATTLEYVVTLSPDELGWFTVGMPVRLTARASRWDGVYDRRADSLELVIRRPSDQALLLAIATGPGDYQGFDVPVARGTPVCQSRPEPVCRRTLWAYGLAFGVGSGRVEPAPGAEALYVTSDARYFVRNRAAVQRVPTGGSECADLTPPLTSFEIVRYPTP